MSGFVDNVLDQTFSRHPYLFLFVVMCSGAVLGHSYSVFAQEVSVEEKFTGLEQSIHEKFDDIDTRINTLDRSVQSQFIQQSIRQLNSEIYDLSNIISTGPSNDRDHERLKDLREDLRVETRKLNKLAVPPPR